MPKDVQREPQLVTKDEFFSRECSLPGRMEWVQGFVGPFNDAGKLALLANWGVDEIVRLTRTEVWRAALAAHDESQKM